MTTQQQPLTNKDVERVASKLFDIVEREILRKRKAISPENLMAEAIKEAGLR